MPTYRYPRPALTVDSVVLGFDAEEADGLLRVLLIQRGEKPFRGQWALPGGFVTVSDERDQGESLEEAARRELLEETGVEVAYLEQLYTFGAPGRDPRGRVITVAYLALVRPRDYRVTAGSDAADARWAPVDHALDGSLGALAFDHRAILERALERVRSKVRYAAIGFHLLPKKFTLGELHALYQAVSRRTLDASNFHKKVQKVLVKAGVVVRTGESQRGQHRPAPLYRFDRRAYERAVQGGVDFEI